MRLSHPVTPLLFLILSLWGTAHDALAATGSPFPPSVSGWRASGTTRSFDRQSVYDELDGGAEVYLEYGLASLQVQRYSMPGEPDITFDLFEMDAPAGAYGAFTFEREDEEAGVGQGSEYGGGLLRFWRGRFFGFVQAERETPASREAVLALGKAVASGLGPQGKEPALARALPDGDQRPRSLRYVRSPLLLQIVEPRTQGNPLGLPPRCEAVTARYGPKGSPERVLVARLADPPAAQKALAAFMASRFPPGAKPAEAVKSDQGFSAATSLGLFVIVVADAPEALACLKRLEATVHLVEEMKP
jgi:hypothetical protein